jgi:hypothetical protein
MPLAVRSRRESGKDTTPVDKPTPYRSAMDAPIQIRAARKGSPEITSHVYPDQVDSTCQRMTDQGYRVTSVTDSRD